MGGENCSSPGGMRRRTGSSPRGRGKHADDGAPADRHGLIPAWAGKTRVCVVCSLVGPAHPRVGGENTATPCPSARSSGSSPRGRGKRSDPTQVRRACRLIPAWAGKTFRLILPPHVCRAHPRVGGENRRVGWPHQPRGGSSPRGRGKPGAPISVSRTSRLIPAWAGKTGSAAFCRSVSLAHPRVGGENWERGVLPVG